MNILNLVIDIIIGVFILTALFTMFSIIMGWIEDKLEVKHEDRTHHDNKPGSYYYESNKKEY
tara:strand:+ start:149 stop:334 length:186 start_codon:yes stop_codon:yes gene_type:complete